MHNWLYTPEQFEEATKELKAIIAEIPGLIRPKSNDVWEVWNSGDGYHSWPNASAHVSEILIDVTLQDDSGDPYPIVELKKYIRPEKRKNWHAACATLNVFYLYPHQFRKIPALVKWLEDTPVPSPAEILDDESDYINVDN
jgi:hypothetical protein